MDIFHLQLGIDSGSPPRTKDRKFVFFFACHCLVLLSIDQACAAEVPLIDLARHAQYRSVKISPEGDYIAANAVIKDKAVLSLLRLSDLKGINLRGDDASEVEDFWWVAPHHALYTIGELTGWHDAPLSTGELFVADADGGHHKLLYGGRRGVGYDIADLVAVLPDDPHHAIVSRRPYLGRFSGDTLSEAYRIDLSTGHTELMATSPLRNADFLADHDGKVRIAYGAGTDWRQKVYYRPDDAADWTLVGDSKNAGDFLPRRFDRSGNNVYGVCDGTAHFGGVCAWNVQTREMTTLWSGPESGPMQLIATTDAKDIFAVSSMPGRPAVSLLDKQAPEAKLLSDLYQRFPGERVSLGASTRDGSKRIVFVDSDINPGDFYLYDQNKKTVIRLLSVMPWIKPEAMAQMEPVTLNARDGVALHGYITRPLGQESAKNLPLVVFPHGGPHGIRDEWRFDPEVQMLASRGYAVLQINFRGSGGYGDKFEHAGYREWGGKMQDDITDATREMVSRGIADPARICIFGVSYGGYAALEGATKEPDLYKCAIGAMGVYDLPLWSHRSDVHDSKLGRSYIQDVLGDDEAQLKDRSPISHLDRLKANVMLIVGGADSRVPPVQGENLHRALTDRKIDHEWLYHVNEGHGFYDVNHRVDMYEKILAFLQRNIGAGQKTAQVK